MSFLALEHYGARSPFSGHRGGLLMVGLGLALIALPVLLMHLTLTGNSEYAFGVLLRYGIVLYTLAGAGVLLALGSAALWLARRR